MPGPSAALRASRLPTFVLARAVLAAGLLTMASVIAGPNARADWLQPDITYREAQLMLRMAVRDTVGRADDPGRLDSLGVALLRLGRLDEAEQVFRRSLALRPGDDAAEAALGKLALFSDRLDEAESLLSGATADPSARADLFAARVRSGRYAAAAALAGEVNQEGRVPLLERMAHDPVYEIASGPEEVSVMWVRSYPVPLVRVKLNGQRVVMAIDTGAGDLLLDESAARRTRVERLPGQRAEFWSGSRVAVRNAMVQRLEIGGLRIERLPAGTLSLGRWSIEVNPHAEPVAGVIGLHLLRRFTPTLDYERQRLELRRPGVPYPVGVEAQRVPFEMWGERELTVYGSLAGSRRMAMVVQTGVPGCGVGAPAEVFDEIGIKSGVMARLVRGAGTWLNGRPWTEVSVPTVAVGPVVQDKVRGWLGALDSGELWRHGVRRDALLSSDFFRGRRVTIDWQAQALVFEE